MMRLRSRGNVDAHVLQRQVGHAIGVSLTQELEHTLSFLPANVVTPQDAADLVQPLQRLGGTHSATDLVISRAQRGGAQHVFAQADNGNSTGASIVVVFAFGVAGCRKFVHHAGAHRDIHLGFTRYGTLTQVC